MKQITRLHGFFHPMIDRAIASCETTPIVSQGLLIKGWKNPCALLAVCLLPVLSPDLSHALEWKDVWQTPDQQGEILLQQEKTEQAAETFEHPGWKAAALYRAEKYKESVQVLDGFESAGAHYNRGNALAKSGDLKAATEAYEQALKIDKTHEDASFNLDLVKKTMQKQQSEQQQSDKNDKSEQKSDEKKQDDQGDKSEQNSGQQSSESEKEKSESQSGQDNDSDGQSSESQQPEQSDNEQSQSMQDDQTQDDAEKEKERQQQAMQSSETKEQKKAEAEEEKMKASAMEKEMDRELTEEEKAQQQWLRRIPDDPGGLLRRKFRYQYRQREQQQASKEEQAW